MARSASDADRLAGGAIWWQVGGLRAGQRRMIDGLESLLRAFEAGLVVHICVVAATPGMGKGARVKERKHVTWLAARKGLDACALGASW